MKQNFQAELDKIIEKIEQSSLSAKPKLLLHACCGPCSSYVVEYLSTYFEITILFYNPNIYPKQEHDRRLEELQTFIPKIEKSLLSKINIVVLPYNEYDFYNAIDIKNAPELAKENEKGERCRRCYEFRLKKTMEYATNNDFDYFCTTLSISPFKDAVKINTIGKTLQNQIDSKAKWLPSDFKKKNGFKRSLELSEEYDLYRQQYCGCIYSMQNLRTMQSFSKV